MSRRALLRGVAAGAGLAVLSGGITACGPRRLAVSRRWQDCTYVALREIDSRTALVGWDVADLRPRVIADLDATVVAWQACATATGTLVGWVPDGGTTHFTVVEPARAVVSQLGVALDTGAFAVVGNTVQVVTPGAPPAVVSYDPRLRAALARADVGMSAVVAIRGTPHGGLAVGTDPSGEVLVTEVAPRANRARTWRTGVRGLAADVVRVGSLTAVSIVRDPGAGPASRSCVVLGALDRPAQALDGWARPGAMAALGRGLFAVADSSGTARVVRVVDSSSGSVVGEHALPSAQTVLGVAAASGRRVMVLQQDGVTLVRDGRAPVTQPVAGLVAGGW